MKRYKPKVKDFHEQALLILVQKNRMRSLQDM